MLITLNTDSVKELDLNYESYAILLLMAENKTDLILDYLNTIYKLDDSKDIYQRYIKVFQDKKLLEDSNECKLTEKAKNIIFGDNLFKEFIIEFPQKVTRTDGTIDFLRTDLVNAENLYLSYVGRSRDKHNHILKCLKAEIKQRESNGTMPYMMRVFKWIANKGWTSYEDIVDEVLMSNKDLGYGTTLI